MKTNRNARKTSGYKKALEIVMAMPTEHRWALIQCSMPYNPVPRKPVVKE